MYCFLECPKDQYKDKIGNKKCTACPENSETTSTGQIQCSCKKNFYNFQGENYTHPCYGECSCVGGGGMIKHTEPQLTWLLRRPSRNKTLLWLE